MSCPPTDPRIRRTRRVLQEAVLALAAEQDFATITVRDITERAEVNRNTFYLHYRDKDDLVDQALDRLFTEFTEEDRAFIETHGQLRPDEVPSPVIALFQHVAARPELYRRLLGQAGSNAFAARLRSFHEKQFLAIWHEAGKDIQPGSPPPELRARVAATSAQGVIHWWLEHGHPESAETMASWLWEILRPLWFGETARERTSE